MNNDAKLLGISLEDGQNLISLLSPKNPLTEISERNVSKIKALRNIIKSYIDSIPTPEKIQIKKPLENFFKEGERGSLCKKNIKEKRISIKLGY